MVDERKGGHFNAFRVMVDANFSHMVQSYLTIVIDGEEYEVMVKEIRMLCNYPEEVKEHEEATVLKEDNGKSGDLKMSGIRIEEEVVESKNKSNCELQEMHGQEGDDYRLQVENEEESSRVQETQTCQLKNNDKMEAGRGEPQRAGSPKEIHSQSPTKTITLEDDRRKGDNKGKAKQKKAETKKKAEKRKKTKRKKKGKIEVDKGVSNMMETISDSEDEEVAEGKQNYRIWKLGARVGISSTNEEKARKYLRDTDGEEHIEKEDTTGRRTQSRSRRGARR
ncbi:hypothetical protein PIB30_091478 [Stylosanthes scabra]|uniref:Uncharacterized protein n=1 Tax=Stylosanthes scabra TaxID=79078 RepID=A0ABU6ZT73_9FABA|nr:hypothetical protein [Stylosanthes scabra]